jgi:lipid-A-disaccharide synthase
MSVSHKKYTKLIKKTENISFIEGYNHELMQYSHFLVVKSGTSTFEAASLCTPFIIVYKANKLSYHIAKHLIKIKYIGMPNIIVNENMITELIQNDVNADKIVEQVVFYLNNQDKYTELKDKLLSLSSMLTTESASSNVNDIMQQLLSIK